MSSCAQILAEANRIIAEKQHQQKVDQRKEKKKAEKKERLRNLVIGELVCEYFPDVAQIEPGQKYENPERFAMFENVLSVLSEDTDMLNELKERAGLRTQENEVNDVNV